MDTVSTENICGKSYKEKKKTRKRDKAIIKDEAQSVGTKMNTWPTEDISEGGDAGNRRKKRKRISREEIEAEVRCETDARHFTEGNPTTMKPKIKDEVHKTSTNMMDIGCTENPAGKMKKKRKGKKANLVGEVQNELDARSTDNLDQENVTIKISKVGLTQMNTGSSEDLADGKVIIEKLKTLDEAQSMDQDTMDTWQLAENIVQGNVAGKRRKKRKKNKAKVNDEDHCEVNTRSTENLAEENATLNKPGIKDAVQSVTQTQTNTGSSDNVAEGNVIIENIKVQDEIQSIDQAKWISPSNDLAEGNVIVKRKKSRKRTKKAKAKDEFSGRMDGGSTETESLAELDLHIKIPETRDEVPSMGRKVMDAGSTENLLKGLLTFENPKIKDEGESMDKVVEDTGPAKCFTQSGKKKKKQRVHAQANVTIENPKFQDEVQSIDQVKVDLPTEDISEENVIVKSKKKRKKTKKAKVKDEFLARMDAESTEIFAEVISNTRIPETRDKVPSTGLKVTDAGSTENLTKGNLTFGNPKITDEGQSMDSGPREDFTKVGKKKNLRRSARIAKIVSEYPSVGRGGTMLNGSSQVSNDVILDKGIDRVEGTSAISTCNACSVKDTEDLCLKMAPFTSVRRKLLVLDINGLLADVVYPATKNVKGEDIRFYGRAVFRRPFCGDFLKFCFQNFYVGIWSSRSKKIIDKVVSYLLGDQQDKLLFCWDMTHSTPTGFKTLENRHKPLVCKELRKIWEKDDPSWPWKMGDYNESNTLLLDDSPYKALLNPLHTAIFPHPYQYSDKNDNSLGPGGDLRVYLEGLLASENVQKYVEQHPFGQSPINEEDVSWEFYDKVLKQISKDKISLVET